MSITSFGASPLAFAARGCSMLASALAAGLAAHLLGTSFDHDGSLRDMLVLAAALCVSALLSGRFKSSAGVIAGIVVASLCIAVGWLFLEDPAHVQFSQVIATLFAAFPVLCALISAVLLFASASIALASAIIELLLGSFPRFNLETRASHYAEPASQKTLQDTGPRLFLRRGPPHTLIAISSSV